MKIVSQLDADGLFVGTVEADESPLEPGEFLLPGGAVDAVPPTIPAGHTARWSNGWVFDAFPAPVPPYTPGPPTVQDKLAQLDADNTLTQRNLREFILLTSEAIKRATGGLVDMAILPGVKNVMTVEAEASVLRGQL
jgi:hypothetical protein